MARPRFSNLDREPRHRILETAAAEFAKHGFEGVFAIFRRMLEPPAARRARSQWT